MLLWADSEIITERSWVNIFKISLEILLSLNHQQTKREGVRDRERQFPMQTCCLRANGSIIMIDRLKSLSSARLNGIGTDQYLHWRWSHILFHLGSNITKCEMHSWMMLPLLHPNLGVWKSLKSWNPPLFIILQSFQVQQLRITGLLQF